MIRPDLAKGALADHAQQLKVGRADLAGGHLAAALAAALAARALRRRLQATPGIPSGRAVPKETVNTLVQRSPLVPLSMLSQRPANVLNHKQIKSNSKLCCCSCCTFPTAAMKSIWLAASQLAGRTPTHCTDLHQF